MKKIKILLISILIMSCSEQNDHIKSLELNANKYQVQLAKTNVLPLNIVDELSRQIYDQSSINFSDVNLMKINQMDQEINTFKITEFTVDDISNVYSESQKQFLFEFYTDIYNGKIDVIEKSDQIIKKIDDLKISNHQKETLKYQVFTFEKIISDSNYIINQIFEQKLKSKSGCDAYFECVKKNLGRTVAQGMVGGAIIGAINGGLTGAAGGTVLFPGIGTATGAIGGAVFGGAKGAIQGGIVGVFWTLTNCMKLLSKECLEKLFA